MRNSRLKEELADEQKTLINRRHIYPLMYLRTVSESIYNARVARVSERPD